MAVLADRSVGYEGTIRESDWMQIAGFGAQYSVLGEGALEVTNITTANRTVRVAAAAAPDAAWGKGILDTWDSPTQLQAQALANGTRYDTVCVARNFATKESRLVILAGSSTRALAASRQTFGGGSQVDHQPLALIRVQAETGTSGVIKEVEDLRCWSSDGGVVAKSVLTHGYLDRLGAKVRIEGFEWSREFNNDGTAVWVRTGGGRLLSVAPGAFYNLPESGLHGPSVRVWGNATQNIAQVDIPDPGVPYRISAAVVGFFGAETESSRWDFDLLVGNEIYSLNLSRYVYSQWQRWSVDPSNAVYTGARTLFLRARLITGAGYGAIALDQRAINARIWQA